MPIYEYECKDCGHRFEALQKISDRPLTECPACGRGEVSKLISAAAFRLKGGGWYETDFKTGNRRHGTQDTASGNSPEKAAASGGKASAGADPGGKSSKSKPAA